MATGIVRGLVGSVTVTDTRGVSRQLRTGDAVELNDTVQAASGSTVHIVFDNGNFATVGSNEKLVLDTSVIDPMAESENKTAVDQSVADIQAMIAAGADPTEIAEATAAGADAGTRGDPNHSGSHSFVVVDQAAARGEVTPGFETGTFSNPLTDTENVDGRLDTFLLDPDTLPDPENPDVPPSNNDPVISDEGQGLFVKESGVGTEAQGGKPGWAIGEHNHAIAGKPVDEGSFRVADADGDTLTATLLDKDGNPMQGVVTDDSGTMTVQTEYGTLTVTPTEGADGSVTYTYHYELDNTLADSLNEGDDPVYEHFQIEVSDGHGGTVTQPVDITIEGTNDAPTLTVDKVTLDVTEQGENVSPDYTGTDSGSAHGMDVDRSADLHYSLIDENGKETTSIKTEYGTLTIDADGKYHFTIDNTSDGVKSLNDGDIHSVGPFTIRVTDEHGAYSEQEIDVNIHGTKDAPVVSDHLVVNEHGLDNPADTSENALIKAPDGYKIIDVENGGHDTVSQDAEGDWHYTLSEAIDSGNNPGANTVTDADSVKMTVEDGNGNRFTVDVKVDVVDDVPVLDLAGSGYHQISVGSGASISEASGSIHYDFGADDGAGKSLTISVGNHSYDITNLVNTGSCTLDGEYGKLTINSDGSYSYQANPNILGNAQDSFVLTITDADGDTKDVKLDVTVTPPSGPDAGSIAHVTVDEAGLNDANNTSEISKPIMMPDGFNIVMSENGYAGSHGIVTFGKDGQWHYTLNEAIKSGDVQGANTVEGADTVKMTVQDTYGNQFTIDVKVDIVDDVPILDLAGSDYHQISVGSGASISEASGSIHYDFGADDGAGKSLTISVGNHSHDITNMANAGSYTIEGEYGRLTVNVDGSYSYQANPNVLGNAQDSFVITIRDADGDSTDVKLDIDVTPAIGPDGSSVAHVTVNEHGLDNVADLSETANIKAPDGYTIVGVADQGTHGTVVQDAQSGNWHYILTEAIKSGDVQGANTVTGGDTVTLTVSDTNGNTFDIKVPVDIIDDVPTISSTFAEAMQTMVNTTDGVDHFKAGFNFDFGADNGDGKTVSVTVDGQTVTPHHTEGNIGENPNQTLSSFDVNEQTGEIIYEQNSGVVSTQFGTQGQAHDITVSVTDSDGDVVSQTIHLETVGVQTGNEFGNTIAGGDGADIIIGDKGHTDGTIETITYNISLVLDVSSSMKETLPDGETRMDASLKALKTLVDSLSEQSAQEGIVVNVQLAGFADAATSQSWMQLTPSSAGELKAYLDTLASYVDAGKGSNAPTGTAYHTNYEASLQNVYKWFADHASDSTTDHVVNKVYFISDGVPNTLDVAFVGMQAGKYINTYTDDLGNEYSVPLDYITGQTVTSGDGHILIDSSGQYYGYNSEAQWTVLGTVKHAAVNQGDVHNLPDYKGPEYDPYNPLFNSDAFNKAQEDYMKNYTQAFDKLKDMGVEVNSGGFAGDGLDKNILDRFDNTNGSDILHNGDELDAFLDPGHVTGGAYAGSDTVYAGAGSDIVFGDHVYYKGEDGVELDGATALAAAVAAAGGDASSNASIHAYLMAHPEFADTLGDPNEASNQNDLLIGGTGHDILVGQGGNDVLIGDGDNSVTHEGSLDHLNNLLGTHAQGDDLAAGIHHLFDQGTAQEIHDFTSGIEHSGIESGHDGNDHLFGGTGNDILLGMGGNDHLYGGEGHDILLGGSGNDVLAGGKGDDIVSGGTGNDTFKYNAGDLDGVTHGDTITDFHLGNLNESNGKIDVNADVLDISELITGHDKPVSLESLVNGGYLSFDDVKENADGTLTVKLSIDVDGHDGSAQMTNLATITMSGFDHHGGTDIVQELMNQLVHNENIKF